VVPLAILSDPCPPGYQPSHWQEADKRSWEYQIMARRGDDDWSVDPATGEVVDLPDGIPEIQVKLSRHGLHQKDNGKVVTFDRATLADAVRQIRTGLTLDDLESRGGELLLNDGREASPPQNLLRLPRLSSSTKEIAELGEALHAIRGQHRVWMLYAPAEKEAASEVRVVGFVVARVVNVEFTGGERDQITVTLQPGMLITATAVTLSRSEDTESSPRRTWGPRDLFNPYVAKVRLVD
jgi:hypothetical protein